MEFRVFRDGKYLCDVNLCRLGNEWAPLEDYTVKAGDVLESVADGTRLEVLYSQPAGYIRAGLKTKSLA